MWVERVDRGRGLREGGGRYTPFTRSVPGRKHPCHQAQHGHLEDEATEPFHWCLAGQGHVKPCVIKHTHLPFMKLDGRCLQRSQSRRGTAIMETTGDVLQHSQCRRTSVPLIQVGALPDLSPAPTLPLPDLTWGLCHPPAQLYGHKALFPGFSEKKEETPGKHTLL